MRNTMFETGLSGACHDVGFCDIYLGVTSAWPDEPARMVVCGRQARMCIHLCTGLWSCGTATRTLLRDLVMCLFCASMTSCVMSGCACVRSW